MIRTTAAALAVALVLSPVAAQAYATPHEGAWPVGAQPIRANGHVVLPCVTTTWRSEQWHKPKTRIGATCYATPDMWVSRYWPRVGTVTAPGGKRLPVYLRTV